VSTTYDRHLIARYVQTFAILFGSVYGLFVVIDCFSNFDEFEDEGGTIATMLLKMGAYYAFHATLFLDMCGPIVAVMTAMIVFALLWRNSELHPILAAGVPTARLLLPVAIGTIAANGLMVINQELIMPRIATELQAPRDALQKGSIDVEPLTDQSSGIYIAGQELSLKPQCIKRACFVLPQPHITQLMRTLRADEAVYHAEMQPAGWLLKNVDTPYSQLKLTERGRELVKHFDDPAHAKDLFVVSELSFGQLYNRLQSSKLLSTAELIRRLRSPAYGSSNSPALLQILHARIVRPLANLVAALLSIPLVLRKESYSLVTNMAISACVLSTILGVSEALAYCGKSGALRPEISAWLPILITGTLFAWLTGIMQT
jgi:lipopolysaccharide export system permease protein